MKEKSIAIIGTLDTKGDQIEYLKQKIEDEGQSTCVINIGVAGEAPFKPTHDRDDVAQATGTSIKEMLEMNDRRAGGHKHH